MELKIKIKTLIIIISISALAGWMLHDYFNTPPDPIIIPHPISAPPVDIDVNTLDCDNAKARLQCFYTAQPELEIKHLEKDQYLMEARLCERNWNRLVDITQGEESYKHLIIFGPFINKDLLIGGSLQYYRFWGRLGLGGEVGIIPQPAQLNHIGGGVAWKF